MSLSMAVFTFLNVWCVTLFISLPLGIVREKHESAMEYEAAPKRIYWRKIAIINTIIAVIVTAALAIIIKTGIVPVRQL